MKNKKLILFTASYPYGAGETFLETEIDYLSEAFDQVLIVSNDVISSEKRVIPANCEVVRKSDGVSKKDKLNALFLIYNRHGKAEKKIIKDIYQLNWSKGIQNTLLISLFRGRRVLKFCQEIMASSEKETDFTFYSYWANDNAIGLALLKEKNPEIKAITRTHGWDLYFEVTQNGYQSFRHLLGEKLDKIYPIAERGVAYCKDRWKVSGSNVELSRLGVSEQNRKYISSSEFTLVSCSNVIPLKRVELILVALKLMKTPIRWVHFGSGKGLDALKNASKELPENITVAFKGHVQNSDVIKWYGENQADVFVNVSTTEGIPVSIMEAMSFGVPVLATDVGGTSEIVNTTNGKLLSPELSAAELAADVAEFISLSENKIQELKNGAYETWNEHYNSEKNYRRFVMEIS